MIVIMIATKGINLDGSVVLSLIFSLTELLINEVRLHVVEVELVLGTASWKDYMKKSGEDNSIAVKGTRH